MRLTNPKKDERHDAEEQFCGAGRGQAVRTGDGRDTAIEMAEDRLWSRLHDAGLRHSDPHTRLFQSAFGAPGPCMEGCPLCGLMPHVRTALGQAANAKVGEAAGLLRAAAGKLGGRGPAVVDALEALALAIEDMRVQGEGG